MVLRTPGPVEGRPLREEASEIPVAGAGQVVVRVDKCGVCRTDLHVVEGDLPPRRSHVIPGHEIVGAIDRRGGGVEGLSEGEVVGVPWLHRACGRCGYCTTSRENLCERKEFTGYSVNGGYAEYVLAEAPFVLPLPPGDAANWAPFLCAGIIGYRALKLASPRSGGRVGFFGFGGSAHLTLQLAARLGFETVAYSRNPEHLRLARELGARATVRTDTDEPGPADLDAAVVFAPAGDVVLRALRELRRGGTVSIAAIHMSPIPAIDYDRWLFGERRIVSVEANTRDDARELLDLAQRFHLRSATVVRPLAEANGALAELKAGRVAGAVVLDCGTG